MARPNLTPIITPQWGIRRDHPLIRGASFVLAPNGSAMGGIGVGAAGVSRSVAQLRGSPVPVISTAANSTSCLFWPAMPGTFVPATNGWTYFALFVPNNAGDSGNIISATDGLNANAQDRNLYIEGGSLKAKIGTPVATANAPLPGILNVGSAISSRATATLSVKLNAGLVASGSAPDDGYAGYSSSGVLAIGNGCNNSPAYAWPGLFLVGYLPRAWSEAERESFHANPLQLLQPPSPIIAGLTATGITGQAAGTIQLSGTGAIVYGVSGQGAGGLTLAGSGAIGGIAGQASGGLNLAGLGTIITGVSAQASGSLSLTGVGAASGSGGAQPRYVSLAVASPRIVSLSRAASAVQLTAG